MNEIAAFLAIAVPAGALVAITVALLRALGPLDLAALWYTPRETTWPRGVQEEDPHPWDFSVPPSDEPPGVRPGPRLGDDRGEIALHRVSPTVGLRGPRRIHAPAASLRQEASGRPAAQTPP